MDNDKVIRLRLNLTDSGSTDEMITKLEQLKTASSSAAAGYETLDRQIGTYTVATTAVQEASDEAVRAAVEATQAQKIMASVLEDKVNPALTHTATTASSVSHALAGAGHGGAPSFGRALIQAQYAADDFSATYRDGGLQRAFMSMQNNIPQIALSLGATGGLTAAIGGLAIATSLAIPTVKGWWEAFWGEDGEKIAKAKEQVKTLREEWEKLTKTPTKAEAAGAKGLQEAIVEGGPENILKGIVETMVTSGRGDVARMTPEEAEQIRKYELGLNFAVGPVRTGAEKRLADYRQQVQDRINTENRDRAQKILTGVDDKGPTGQGARDTLGALIELNPRAFPAGLLGDVKNADPEAVKAQADLEAQGKIRSEQLGRQAKERADFAKDVERARKEEEQRTKKQFAEAIKAGKDHEKLFAGIDDDVSAEKHFEQEDKDTERAGDKASRDAKHAADKAARDAESGRKEGIQSQIDTNQQALREMRRSEQLNSMQVKTGQMTQQMAEWLKNQNDFKEWAIQDQITKLQQSMRGSASPR